MRKLNLRTAYGTIYANRTHQMRAPFNLDPVDFQAAVYSENLSFYSRLCVV